MLVPGIFCKALALHFDLRSFFAVLKWYETKKRQLRLQVFYVEFEGNALDNSGSLFLLA